MNGFVKITLEHRGDAIDLKRRVYWSLVSRLRERLHQELHTPIAHCCVSYQTLSSQLNSKDKRPTYLVKVEDEVQLTHISEKSVKNFDEEVDCFQVRKLVIIGVYANAKE